MTPEDYLAYTHTHILENIKFADQKAIAFIAIDSAIIAALFGGEMLILDLADFWLTCFSVLTFALLGAAVVFGGLVIWPRGERMGRDAEGSDLAIPSNIALRYRDKKRSGHIKLAEAVSGAVADSGLKTQLASLVLVRAEVNFEKYRRLDRAIVLSALGFLSTATFVVIHSL